MRVLALIAVCTALASYAHAEVFVTVYRCDGKTPLALLDPNTPGVYSDIMVGTRLVLIVSSDKSRISEENAWWGSLLSTSDDWERGRLLGRGYDPNHAAFNYRDSCLPAAGSTARVAYVDYFMPDGTMIGFDLNTGSAAAAGDWFVLDYVAEGVGSCDVRFFDYAHDFVVAVETLSFTHVPSRDLDSDTLVSLADFALLASHWRQAAGLGPNMSPACDIDGNHLVDLHDVALFCEYWLERTDCNEPAGGLSASAAQPGTE